MPRSSSCSPARSCSPRRRETRRQKAARAAARKHETVFEISDLHAGAATGVSLAAERGEIVGIAGLAGSGRDTVLGAAFGSLPRDAGEVKVAGKPLPASRPDVAIGQGVAYVAPDRKIGGGVMTMSARENLTLPDLKPFWKGGIVRRKAEKARTKEWFERLSVRPANAVGGAAEHLQRRQPAEDPVREVAVPEADRLPAGRADPGRGRRRQEPTCIVSSSTAAEDGAAVLVSSSDLEELADLCDRVLVIVDGKISSVLEGAELTEGAITRSFMPLAAEPVDGS